MHTLVTGSTGTVGSKVVAELAGAGVSVRALTRSPQKASFPDGVEAVGGELTDPAALRAALDGVDSLFLLSPVVMEELNATLFALTLARDAGVANVAYLSVICADRFTDPPHFAAKRAAELAIEDLGIAATILRPGYYMQNDAGSKAALLEHGTYPAPLGSHGVQLADVRDIAELAARSLLARDRGEVSGIEVFDVVSPETLTGPAVADIWSEALGRPVRYGGDDLDRFESALAANAPGWLAYDMRLMMGRYQADGALAAPGTDERLAERLGRPARTYRDFARETAESWRADDTVDSA